MQFYQCDKTYTYVKPLEAPSGSFGSPEEMRKKRIFSRMRDVRRAQEAYVREKNAKKEERKAK